MKNKKRAQTGIIPALLIVLGSLVFVSAVAINSTVDISNQTINETFNLTFGNN